MRRSTPQPWRSPAPLRRSLTVQASASPGALWWGATWAWACGVLAAAPWPIAVDSAGRLALSWLVAVPLAGACWVRLLDTDRDGGARTTPVATPAPGASRLPTRVSAADGGRWSYVARLLERAPDWALAALAGVLLAAAIGTEVAVIVAVALAAVAAVHRAAPRLLWPSGIARAVLEIGLPALVGRLALTGAPADAGAGASAVAGVLGPSGAAFGLVLAGFVVAYHGATSARGAHELALKVLEVRVGYLVVIAALVAVGQTLAAAFVALALVTQLPFQVALAEGRVRWHLAWTQGAAMVAMLAAFAGL